MMEEAERNHVDMVMANEICFERNASEHFITSAFSCGFYSKADIEKNIYKSIVVDEVKAETGIFCYLPGKVFLRDKLIKIFEDISESIHLGEDGAVSFAYMLSCNSLSIVACSGYHYVYHSDSVSWQSRFSYFEELKILQTYLKNKFDHIANSDVQMNIFIRDLLIIAVRNFYHLEMGRILCLPPYECIEKGSRLVIYGAGQAGQAFVKQFLYNGYADIVGWVDRGSGGTQFGINVQNPEAIVNMEYDHILIAVTDETTVSHIKKYLVSIGIPLEKMIWKPIYWG
jgi:hypothetical protein